MSNPIQNQKISELALGREPAVRPSSTSTNPAEFAGILADRLKVSGHAKTRLESRNIQLDGEQWERVLGGVDQAASKGAKESLVMLDDVALVVSIKNRTVITAVDKSSLKNNVFTNIDSAVVV